MWIDSLAVLYVILQKWIPRATWHGPLQVACDIGMITGVVYTTGAQDSYFTSLYLLGFLMGAILFSRRGATLTAAGSFILLGSVVECGYYGMIPRTSAIEKMKNSARGALNTSSWRMATNLFAFFAVAYLGSVLAESLRHKGFELEERKEELKDLQAFNGDIIHSMRGLLAHCGLKR